MEANERGEGHPADFEHFSDLPLDLQKLILDAQAGKNLGKKYANFDEFLIAIGLEKYVTEED